MNGRNIISICSFEKANHKELSFNAKSEKQYEVFVIMSIYVNLLLRDLLEKEVGL